MHRPRTREQPRSSARPRPSTHQGRLPFSHARRPRAHGAPSQGYGGTINGRCGRCGHLAEKVRCTNDGSIDYPPTLCYEGPHRSGEEHLTALRMRTLGEDGYRRQFGGGDQIERAD
eukprot:4028563-Prymnesium_polylepis.2